MSQEDDAANRQASSEKAEDAGRMPGPAEPARMPGTTIEAAEGEQVSADILRESDRLPELRHRHDRHDQPEPAEQPGGPRPSRAAGEHQRTHHRWAAETERQAGPVEAAGERPQTRTLAPAAATPPAAPAVLQVPAAEAPAEPQVLGGIDRVSESGQIAGWAWRGDGVERCHVRVLRDGEVVAEALADAFRADLLQAGMGLGHCGFYARLRVSLPPGPVVLQLVEARLGVAVGAPFALEAPSRLSQPLASPLLVLTPRPTWRDEDVLENLPRFDFAGQCEAMGAQRFVDSVFQFALGRWPEGASRQTYITALEAGDVHPDAFVEEVLLSPERKAMTTPLPSPFDYRFPFRIPST